MSTLVDMTSDDVLSFLQIIVNPESFAILLYENAIRDKAVVYTSVSVHHDKKSGWRFPSRVQRKIIAEQVNKFQYEDGDDCDHCETVS